VKVIVFLVILLGAVALFVWPGFLSVGKEESSARIEAAKQRMAPNTSLNERGEWTASENASYPIRKQLVTTDDETLSVLITGRSQYHLRFRRNETGDEEDYPILSLDKKGQKFARGLGVSITD